MGEWLSETVEKLIGAGVGSSIAIIHRPLHGGILKSCFRWAVGVAAGFYGPLPIIEMFGWPVTQEMILFVASCLGITGFSLVELALSGKVKDAVLDRIRGGDARKAEE